MNYNKKLKYRRNYEYDIKILDIDYASLIIILPVSLVISLVMVVFSMDYGFPFKAFDFAFLALILPYQLFIRPKIYRGEIKAYYRRSYGNFKNIVNWTMLFGLIGAWKYLMLFSYHYYNTKDLLAFAEGNFHYVVTPLTVFSLLFIFYYSFYQDKYSTIREYSNTVNYYMKNKKMNENGAVNTFKFMKDKEYNIKEYAGTYYDMEEEILEEKPKEKRQEATPLRRTSRLDNRGDNYDRS